MKNIFALLLICFSSASIAVCLTPLVRTNISANSVLTATRYNADVNGAYNRLNNLPGDCVTGESITASKLANNTVTSLKIAPGAITAAKIATNTFPEAGRLIRVSSFTASGTWTRQADIGSVLIQVVGGGGASFHASSTSGGSSSFGGHCTASGGGVPTSSSSTGGVGGIATGGDINLPGGQGELSGTVFYNSSPILGGGGLSAFGQYGKGGIGSVNSPSSGGGAGGYCAKLISRASLNATEAVTVGVGGTNPSANTTPGNPGIVIVYEYSK
jgi:hypothetical protein